MAELQNVITTVANLENAIEDALRHEVADVVKNAIIMSAYENVYKAYAPEFYSRRWGAGGILDPNSIKIEVHGDTLIASDNAAWQQLWGGSVPGERLAEAIASGDKRFNMQEAGPRPFHQKAKEEAIYSGAAEDALRRGLARQGIDTSGMTFTFT